MSCYCSIVVNKFLKSATQKFFFLLVRGYGLDGFHLCGLQKDLHATTPGIKKSNEPFSIKKNRDFKLVLKFLL